MDVHLAEPPGARSCGRGGTWQCCRGPGNRNTNYWMAEFEALLFQCSEADRRLLRSELKRKMERATRGDLVFGKSRDVYRIQVCPIVLELRVRSSPGTPSGKRVVRLYFSEPAHEQGMLLAAKLAWKPPLGKAEQNEHAKEAGERIRAFFT